MRPTARQVAVFNLEPAAHLINLGKLLVATAANVDAILGKDTIADSSCISDMHCRRSCLYFIDRNLFCLRARWASSLTSRCVRFNHVNQLSPRHHQVRR